MYPPEDNIGVRGNFRGVEGFLSLPIEAAISQGVARHTLEDSLEGAVTLCQLDVYRASDTETTL